MKKRQRNYMNQLNIGDDQTNTNDYESNTNSGRVQVAPKIRYKPKKKKNKKKD